MAGASPATTSPAPVCPTCGGKGRYEQVIPGWQAPTLVRNTETKQDDPAMVPYVHEVVCACRLVVVAPDAAECGLAGYAGHTLASYDPADFLAPGGDRAAWTAITRWVAELPSPGGGFVFHGGVGTGKTRLAATLAQHARLGGLRPRMVSEPDLLAAIRGTYNREDADETQVLSPLLRVPLLILDDVGAGAMRAIRGGEREEATWYSERLFTLIDTRTRAGLPLILTSNLGMRALVARLGEATISRLHTLRWVLFQGEDRRAYHEGGTDGRACP